MAKIDPTFILYACDILAETGSGLSGMKIAEYSNSYAIKYNRVIPHGSYPFNAPNKRTALRENLNVFDKPEQFTIIKELCELLPSTNEKVKELKSKLFISFRKDKSNRTYPKD